MPYQPIENVAQVDLGMVLDGERVQNTFHFLKAAGWNTVGLTDLASAVVTWWDDALSLHLSNDLALHTVTATDLTSLESDRVVNAVDPVLVGKIVGDAAPNNVSLAVKYQTAQRGRGRAGRMFLAGIPEADIANSRISTGYRNNILTDVSNFFTGIEGVTGATHVVAARYRDGVKLPTGLSIPIVSYAITDLVVDSQRTRLPDHKKRSRRTAP